MKSKHNNEKPRSGKGENHITPEMVSLLQKPSKAVDCPTDIKFEHQVSSLSEVISKQCVTKIVLEKK